MSDATKRAAQEFTDGLVKAGVIGKVLKLQCICCEHEEGFEDAEAAFQAGWDAPPHFSLGPLCDLCPASLMVLGISHDHAHMQWMLTGRPKAFSPATCGTKEEMGA